MQEGTHLLIYALVYSGSAFILGITEFHIKRYVRGLIWQGIGVIAMAIFTVRALLYVGWTYGLLSGIIFVLEFAYFIHFSRRLPQSREPERPGKKPRSSME
jgi:thiamine transporter ThiT